MEWWQYALVNFGSQSSTWQCLICQVSFASADDLNNHVTTHNLQEFQDLKFQLYSNKSDSKENSAINQNESLSEDKSHVLLKELQELNDGENCIVNTQVDNMNSIDGDCTVNNTSSTNLKEVIQAVTGQPDNGEKPNNDELYTDYTHSSKKKIEKNSKRKKASMVIFSCDDCHFTGKSHVYFHKHLMNKHLNEQQSHIQCWYCEKKLRSTDKSIQPQDAIKNKRKLVKNWNVEAEISTLDFTCPICSYCLPNNLELDVHLKFMHPKHVKGKSAREIQSLKDSSKADETAAVISAVAFYCHICNWKSNRHFNYHRHVLSHTIGKSFQCSYCDKVIQQSNSSTGYGQISHMCHLCNLTFHSKFKLNSHLYEDHGQKAKGTKCCKICGFVSRSVKDIERHHLLEHKLQPFTSDSVEIMKKPITYKEVTKLEYRCDDCDFVCNRNDTMFKHSLTHVPTDQRKIYKCEVCDYKTYVLSSLNMHISKRHKNIEAREKEAVMYSCDICMKFASTDKNDMKTHRNSCILIFDEEHNSTNEDVLDAIMQPELNDSHALHTSLKTVSSVSSGNIEEQENNDKSSKVLKKRRKCERIYLCDKCDQTFKRRWNLERHREFTHGRKEEKCEHCDYRTKQTKVLYKHYTNVHQIEAPKHLAYIFQQNQINHKTFKEKQDIKALTLKRPSSITLNSKKVKCQFCGVFVLEINLQSHIQAKHFNKGKFPFRCHHTECNYKSTTAQNLKSHIRHFHQCSSVKQQRSADNEQVTAENLLAAADGHDMICAICMFKTSSLQEMLAHQESQVCIDSTLTQTSLSLGEVENVLCIQCDNCSYSANSYTDLLQHCRVQKCSGRALVKKVVNSSEKCLEYHVMSDESLHQPVIRKETLVDLQDECESSQAMVASDPPSYSEAIGSKCKYIQLEHFLQTSASKSNIKELPMEIPQCSDNLDLQHFDNILNENDKVSPDLDHSFEYVRTIELESEKKTLNRNENYNTLTTDKYLQIPLTPVIFDKENKSINKSDNSYSQSNDANKSITEVNDKVLFTTDVKLLNTTQIDRENICEEDTAMIYVLNDEIVDDMESNQTDAVNSVLETYSSSSAPQFVIEKQDDNTTLITVQNIDKSDVSFKIQGHLNVGPNGELAENLYNFIQDILTKQGSDENSEGVMYCDIVVNEKN